MLMLLILNPWLHKRSGFKAIELNIPLKNKGLQKEEIMNALRQHLQSHGFEMLDGTQFGYDIMAMPSVDSLSFVNPNARQVRLLIKATPNGDDLLFQALIDVKEYVLTVSWETKATTEIAELLQRFLRNRYPDQIDWWNAPVAN